MGEFRDVILHINIIDVQILHSEGGMNNDCRWPAMISTQPIEQRGTFLF